MSLCHLPWPTLISNCSHSLPLPPPFSSSPLTFPSLFPPSSKLANGALGTQDLSSLGSMKGIKVDTANGDVTILEPLSVQNLNVKIANGNFNSADKDISITNSTTLDLTNCGTDVRRFTANGKATVTGVNSPLKFKKLGPQSGKALDASFDVTNGEIDLTVTSDMKASYTADATNGDISVDSKDAKSGNINGGGSSKLTLKSTNGGIKVAKA
eukprot:TRINITY_DN1241_c0_g1_i2.p1 TRINITY_DN1241_c0_g1~~TRINITY_DN1241_c0_g1_i2.p1  ORF type:complete len:212 (+),score=65.62 TRINITY_DN1241_c0_g1_i2:435-1070(+)